LHFQHFEVPVEVPRQLVQAFYALNQCQIPETSQNGMGVDSSVLPVAVFACATVPFYQFCTIHWHSVLLGTLFAVNDEFAARCWCGFLFCVLQMPTACAEWCLHRRERKAGAFHAFSSNTGSLIPPDFCACSDPADLAILVARTWMTWTTWMTMGSLTN
jgi:hypothetical protein